MEQEKIKQDLQKVKHLIEFNVNKLCLEDDLFKIIMDSELEQFGLKVSQELIRNINSPFKRSVINSYCICILNSPFLVDFDNLKS